jgi:hypothetical protein
MSSSFVESVRRGLKRQVRLRDLIFPIALVAQAMILHRWSVLTLLLTTYVPAAGILGIAHECWLRRPRLQ